MYCVNNSCIDLGQLLSMGMKGEHCSSYPMYMFDCTHVCNHLSSCANNCMGSYGRTLLPLPLLYSLQSSEQFVCLFTSKTASIFSYTHTIIKPWLQWEHVHCGRDHMNNIRLCEAGCGRVLLPMPYSADCAEAHFTCAPVCVTMITRHWRSSVASSINNSLQVWYYITMFCIDI